jgi:peptidoglycan/xylan/chitin deacetylase (PgdA/CDA1 family)
MVFLFKKLFPSLTWKIDTGEKILFLTFDDGPIPHVTPWVLDTLKAFNARATFFCVGENVQNHPALFKRIVEEEHTIGNHTMRHLNGWRTPDADYFSDIETCDKLVGSKLFRPPYGRIRLSQIRGLKNKYKIVMWDVLSRDYDNSLDGMQCFSLVKSKARHGSVVVFHDSLKADDRLRVALPETLRYFSQRGFRFESIR